MADLNQIEQEVAGLIRDESTDFEFRDAFVHLEEAAKSTTNADLLRLRNILSSFRSKIPNLISLKPIKARAKDLADTLTLNELSERITQINARNELLARLTGELKTQIAKANQDATLLKRIKDAVDTATKTVEEVKSLISQLSAADGTRETLMALVNQLSAISSIFEPQT